MGFFARDYKKAFSLSRYVFYLIFLELCPTLQETEGMVITYNDDRKTRSTATFYCSLPRVLIGVSITTCKWNGEWADPMPVCESMCTFMVWFYI